MSQFTRDWLSQISAMQLEMNQLLDHFAGSKPPMVSFSPLVWEPAIDLYETDDSLVVIVELAGVEQPDIHIVVDQDTFIVEGERKREAPKTRRVYHRMEIASGPFRRAIKLPKPVDLNGVRASYENGLVEVVMPKLKVNRTRTFKIGGA